MEINKDHHKCEQIDATYSEIVLYNKEGNHHHLHLTETLRGSGKALQWKRGASSFISFDWGCWHGEAIGRLTRSKASYVIGLGENIWLPLIGPELEAGTKNREAYNNWPNPDCWRLVATKFLGQSAIDHVRLHIQSVFQSSLFIIIISCEWLTNLGKARNPDLHLCPLVSIVKCIARSWLFCCIIQTVICPLWQKWEQLIVSMSCFRSRDTNCSIQAKRTNSTGHEG